MERKEKSVERERKGKKQQELQSETIKLKRGLILVGKRGGPSTPPPTWRLQFSSLDGNNTNNPIQEFLNTATTVSARKLCANLWEIQPHLQLSRAEISKNIAPGVARRSHHKKKKKKKKKKALELHTHLFDPPNNPPDQSAIVSPSRRNVAQSLAQHHQSVDRNRNSSVGQPLSSGSCGRLMKMAPYNPVGSPHSSLDFKGRMGESSYSLKTSAELLNVLNRIWTLEEKQSCNMSLLKSLKEKLNRSQSQIKELLKEKESNRQEMDNLMKQVAEDKVIRKNKEQDRIKAIIQSARADLENERKLQKHSESLHRKLAQELSQVKSAFSNALKELERERKARILLENLCDEFAKGIRDYEQEVWSLRHKPDTDHVGRGRPDRLILHISEAWLDERMQMGLAEGQNDVAEKNTIVDKLSLDIETFLQARHSHGLRKNESFLNETVNNYSRRESFPLNEAVSAPPDAADEEDSIDIDSHYFDIKKSANRKQSICRSKVRGNNSSESHLLEETMNSDPQKRMTWSRENNKDRYLARLHARFNSNDVVNNLIRNHSVSSEGDKIHPEGNIKEDSYAPPVFAKQASPVQQWMSKLESSEFDRSESKLPSGIKEHTLKAKLLEARLESQKSRLKTSKASC